MSVDQASRIEALEQQAHLLTQNFPVSSISSRKSIIRSLANSKERIDAKLEDQMQRIEVLLSKKMRHE